MSGSSQLYRIKCQIFSVFKNLCTSPSLRGTSCPDQCSVIGSQCSEFSDGPSPRRSVLRVHGPSLDLSPVTCSCRELPGSEQNSSPWRSSMSTKDKSHCLILKNTDVAKLPSATTRAPRTNFQEVPYRKKQSQNLLRSFSGDSTAVLRLRVVFVLTVGFFWGGTRDDDVFSFSSSALLGLGVSESWLPVCLLTSLDNSRWMTWRETGFSNTVNC